MSTPSPADAPCCAAARSEERAVYQETWKANLPLIAARHFRGGYAAALAGDPLPEWALVEPPPRHNLEPAGALVKVTPEATP